MTMKAACEKRTILSSSSSVPARRRGLSLIEVVVSTFLIGFVLVGALRAFAASVRASDVVDRRAQAVLLADELMAEILRQPYEQLTGPAAGTSLPFGGTANRLAFDEVDDYANWTATPPQSKNGTERTELTGWTRRAEVAVVNADDFTQVVTSDSGVKRITVRVEFNGDVLATLQSIQTRAWINMIPEPGHNRTTGSQPGA